MQNKTFKSCFAAVLCGLAATANAVDYDLWVNNERFTSSKLTINCGSGTAVFNGSSTLTLNSALITNSCAIDGLGAGIVSRLSALTVTVNSSCIISNVWGAGITTANSLGGGGAELSRNLAFAGTGLLRIHTTNAATGYGVYCTGDSWNQSATKIYIHSATTGICAKWRFAQRSSNLGFTIITDSGPGIFTTNSFDYASGAGSYLNIDAAGDGIVCGTYSHSDVSPLAIKAGGYGIRRTLPGGLTISDLDQTFSIESVSNCFDVSGSITLSRHGILRSKDQALATTNGAITLGARRFNIASTNTAIQASTSISASSSTITVNAGAGAFQANTSISATTSTITSESGSTSFKAATGLTLDICTVTAKVSQASSALAELTSGTFKITRGSYIGTSAGRGFVLGDAVTPAAFHNLSGKVALATGGDGLDGTTGSTARFWGGIFRVTGAAGTKSINLADGDSALILADVAIIAGGVSQPNIAIGLQASYTWAATAPGALWNDAASWAGGEVPYNTDIVRFEAPYPLAAGVVPDDFTGTFNVAAGVALTNEIPNDGKPRVFSTAVEEGGIFVKTGAGTVSIKPQPGHFPGAIEVAAGTVTFRGNGRLAAPGMFGNLAVAPGATVNIADSPFADRHGALTKSTPWNSATTDPSSKYTTADDLRGMWDAWAGIVGASTNTYRKFWTPAYDLSGSCYLYGSAFFAVGSERYENWGRAIWLCSFGEARYMGASADNAGRIFIDDINCSSSATRTFAKGWHNIDWSHWDDGGGESIYLRFGSKQTLPGEAITADFLWNGVCFGTLDLAAGATLDIGSGQAVGFASAGTHKVAGTVTGAADSCLTIALAGTPFVLDDVAAFPGLVEVGYPAKAKATTDQSAAAYTIIGHGEVIASTGVDARVGSAFEGTVNVGEGATFTQKAGLSTKISYTGSGTIVSAAGLAIPTKGFSGSVTVADGMSLVADGSVASGWTGMTLQDGATLEIPASFLARSGREEALQDWTTGAWSLNGTTRDGGYAPGAAYVDSEGALVLTDDGGRQRRSAFMTNTVFLLSDVWQLSFTYQASLPGKHASERPGEGLAVILQAGSATACDTDLSARYAMRATDSTALRTAHGFAFKHNASYDTGFDWVGMGGVGTDLGDSPAALGMDLLQPIDVTIAYADRRLAITLKQGDVKAGKFLDLTTLMNTYGRFWFGFAAGTGPTDGTVVGLRQKISNFSGWIYRDLVGESLDGYSISSENWDLKGNVVFVNNESEFILTPNSTTNCAAVAKTGLDLRQGYRVDAQMIVQEAPSEFGDPRIYCEASIGMQGYGTNYFVTAYKNIEHGFMPSKPNIFGFEHQTDNYATYYSWSWFKGLSARTACGVLNTSPYPHRGSGAHTNCVSLYYTPDRNLSVVIRRFARDGVASTAGYSGYSLNGINAFTNAWLTFLGAGPDRTRYRPVRIRNVSVQELVNGDLPVHVPVTVADGASVALAVGGSVTNATAPVATVEILALGTGSALSLTNLAGSATIAGIGNLVIGGAGERITTATNVVLALDAIDLTQTAHPGVGNPPLVIVGNWTMRGAAVTIRMPQSWAELNAFDVIDFAMATYVGTGTPVFRVVLVGDDGSEYVTQIAAQIGANTRFLRVNPRFGMMILVR